MARSAAPVALAPPVPPVRRRRWSVGTSVRDVQTLVVTGCAIVLIVGLMFFGPVPGPTGLLLLGIAVAAGSAMLGSPMVAVVALLVASFTRSAIQVPALPSEPMILALAATVVSLLVARYRNRLRVHVGWFELAMALYLLWNIGSWLWPHMLPATEPSSGQVVSVYRFIITGTVLPFVAFLVGRSLMRAGWSVRPVLTVVVVLAGYSALLSILQFTGPSALVWPRYVADSPEWPDRAVGIFNQPVVNGLLMVAGLLTGLFVAHEQTLAPFWRFCALLVAVLCVPGIYLTRTRAVWLAFGVGLVLCAVWARGRRTGFVVVLAGALGYIAATWTTFTSSDRSAGGVGSSQEVDDRLNTIATSLWAIEKQPVAGWGVGRFAALNTYYHQKWSADTDYLRGYAISSHENELGIAAELGLVGLALWLVVLVGVAALLLRALRRLPATGLDGRPLGLLALTVFITWVVCGLTVDLRFFDFANLLVFLLVGAAVGLSDAVAARAAPDVDPAAVAVRGSAA